MDGIQIQVERFEANPDVSVIMINGYIDTTTSSELERVIQNLLREQRYKIIVDLSGVDYISSAGWGIFISEIKNLRSHRGDLKLANMSPNVGEVYELLEFATILTSAPSVPDAARMFDGAASDAGAGGKKESATSTSGKPAAAAAAKPAAPAAPARPAAAAPLPATKPATSPTPSMPRTPIIPIAKPAPKMETMQPAPVAATPAPKVSEPVVPAAPAPNATGSALGLVSLIDRIKEVVKAHPDWGAWKIKNELNSRRGDQPKVSWGEVRAELKFSQLKTKEQRYTFSRGR